MNPIYNKHIFICNNQRPADAPKKSCGSEHGKKLLDLFREKIKEKKLPINIRTQTAGCLGICNFGPTIAIYPEGVFYVGVQEADVAEIIEEHLIKNNPVKRLLLNK